MAKIVIQGDYCTATLTEPDDEGEYGFVALCGATEGDWGYQPIEDMIQAAENHVDSPLVPGLPHFVKEDQ